MCGIEDSDDSLNNVKAYSIKQEMAFYTTNIKNAEPTIESFWKKYANQLPLLASLVRKYCIIPATSVPCESSFSIANWLQRKERSSLSSTSLKYSMILREKFKLDSFFEDCCKYYEKKKF
jgi:hypothetical protein